jgi:pyrroline-5-carboxylate reductase
METPVTRQLPQSLVLAGAGKMGGALLEGWLRTGLAGRTITVLDPHVSPECRARCQEAGVALNPAIATLGEPEVLVLAFKPQLLDAAAPALRALAGPGTLVLSILAGKTIADLARRFERAGAIARAMPNLPAAVQRGISAVAADRRISVRQKALAGGLLAGIGQVEWLEDEGLIDAVTAVSGSGPAYVFHLVECLAQAGAAAGLPADLAERLARATVVGSGELLRQSELSPGTLRQSVTSPGGTTAAALEVLTTSQAMAKLLSQAVAAAKQRAGELSG